MITSLCSSSLWPGGGGGGERGVLLLLGRLHLFIDTTVVQDGVFICVLGVKTKWSVIRTFVREWGPVKGLCWG